MSLRLLQTHYSTSYLLYLLFGTALLGLGTSCQPDADGPEGESTAPPNILIIMADDMGYSDIGSYGSEIATPNLDALATGGVRFRHFYNAARCCPTRASLLTGLYPHEAGMGKMVGHPDSPIEPGPYQGFLSDSSLTIAELLSDAGYATYMSGKWHVGGRPEHWPRQRGFDRYFGLVGGASSYYELIGGQAHVRQMALDDSLWYPPDEGFYMTDAFTDYADQFLSEHFRAQPDQPFLLYLAYTAPHWPLHALPEDIAKYEGRYNDGWHALRNERYQTMQQLGVIDSRYVLSPWDTTALRWDEATNHDEWARRMEVYAAMIDRMDQGIGRVLQRLRDNDALDNTLVLFLADNGGCAEDVSGRKLNDPRVPIGERGSYVAYRKPWAVASNTPFRRYKKWTEEGGMATPLIVHWPAGIDATDRWVQPYGHVMDILATCADVAGVPYPESYDGTSLKPLRGTSLMPLINDTLSTTSERPLYWEHFGHQAMRQGRWKIVSYTEADSSWALFNMERDPTELHDVSAEHPEVMQQMQADYQAWAEEVGI